jgi:membrane AbrB-like protein
VRLSRSDLAHAVTLLVSASVGAAVLGLLRLPAGVLIGSVVGSALANHSRLTGRRPRPAPAPVRVLGLVLLGCAVATRVDRATVTALLHLAAPVLGSVALLLVVDVALACVLVRRYQVDAVTAALACAPGGFSAISVMAVEMNARMGVVLAIHTVRILAVVLVVLPILVVVLSGR